MLLYNGQHFCNVDHHRCSQHRCSDHSNTPSIQAGPAISTWLQQQHGSRCSPVAATTHCDTVNMPQASLQQLPCHCSYRDVATDQLTPQPCSDIFQFHLSAICKHDKVHASGVLSVQDSTADLNHVQPLLSIQATSQQRPDTSNPTAPHPA
jgi:hypothetical protein